MINEGSKLVRNGNMFRETPLLIACKYGHEDTVRRLLAASSLANLLWPQFQPCLHVAAYGGHLGVIKLLFDESKKSSCWREVLFWSDAQGATPLHTSVYGGHIDVVREILMLPLSLKAMLVTRKDGQGRCAIHVAVINGRIDIVDEFMSSVPHCTEIRSADGKTALHFAVAFDRLQLVKKLLCDTNQYKVVKLVSYDHDIFGNTTLHLAAQNAVDPQLMKYLLSFPGVNVNVVNNEGLTALDVAVAASSNNSTNHIIRILKEHGASATEVSKTSFREKDSKAMDVDTLVASLIATVTFAAIFQVPGGIEDDKNSLQYGVARLAFQPCFKLFLFSDVVALFTSLTVVVGWICRERFQSKSGMDKSRYTLLSAIALQISIFFTAITFLTAVHLVIIPPNVRSLKTTNKEVFLEYRTLFNLVTCTTCITVYAAIRFGVYFMEKNTEKSDLPGKFNPVDLLMNINVFIVLMVVVVAVIVQYLYWG